jgi:hypothetical protein
MRATSTDQDALTILMDACINIGRGASVLDVGDYSFDVEGINAGLA